MRNLSLTLNTGEKENDIDNVQEERLDFETLVEKYCTPLYIFALCLSQNETKAAELTQATFQLWIKKDRQLRNSSKIKTWLFATLYHRFLGARRREILFSPSEIEERALTFPDIPLEVTQQINGGTVVEAMMRVDWHYRVPLILFYLENHSYTEIAEVLKIRPDAVVSLLARGKQQMHQILSEANQAA